MPSLAEKIRFSETHIVVPDGGRFSTKGREWLVDEYWRPLDGYHLWPVEQEVLCDACRVRAGGIVDSYWEPEETRSPKHFKSAKCRGLDAHPIWLILIQLKRQSGKTTGTVGYALPTIFKDRREELAYIAGSEDQAERLFRDNFARPVLTNKKLAAYGRVVGNRIEVAEMESSFEFVPTSLAGTTGGSKTAVIVDEARAVPAPVALALMPQIFARNGWRCPTRADGHTKTNGDLEDPGHPTKCGTCGLRLEPWIGKVVAMSSAQELDGSEKDWFHEACEEAERNPRPGVHLYRSQDVVNPKVAKQVVSRMQEFFGNIEATADIIEIETGNTSRRRGEPFITTAQLNAVMDKNLRNMDHAPGPCVAFLDTSITVELTSLVFVGDESLAGEPNWHRLATWRIDVWDPKKLPGGVINSDVVEAALDTWMPVFRPLALRVDTRRMDWAMRLVAKCRNEKPWGRTVDGVTWRDTERQQAWQAYEERILVKRMRMQDHPILRKELKAARKIENANRRVDVREANRRRRHLDIAESIASCVYIVDFELRRPKAKGLAEVRETISTLERLRGSSEIQRRIDAARGPLVRSLKPGPESY
jgi:hypothetical protein